VVTSCGNGGVSCEASSDCCVGLTCGSEKVCVLELILL
jgi:hypothetical protein